jgi:steroid delta-isomerase
MIVADPQRAAAVVEAYVAAFAAGDARSAADLYAYDATVEDPVGAPLVRGASHILAFYERAMGIGLRLERTGPVRVAGDSAAFPFRIHYPPTAERRVIDVIDTFRFDAEGRILEMRAFWGPANIQAPEESSSHA